MNFQTAIWSCLYHINVRSQVTHFDPQALSKQMPTGRDPVSPRVRWSDSVQSCPRGWVGTRVGGHFYFFYVLVLFAFFIAKISFTK